MKSRPVAPARIAFGAPGEPPFAPDFGDLYHPRVGAFEQARHVFLAGNGLPGRWARRARFTVLETGFGLGNNFLATWQAWRDDSARCTRLLFVSVEKHPPTRDDLARAHAACPAPALASALVSAWPPLTPDLHMLDFEGGAVRLLLAIGDVADWLPELRLAADAVYLDGFAPARNAAMWSLPLLKAVGRRAAPGATAATWSVARELRDGLHTAGFEAATVPGIGGKREITVARFSPRFTVAPPPQPPRDVLVIGAGVAGAMTAAALAEEGCSVHLLDRQPQPGQETSSQAGGIFHGTVHAEDGLHARLLRAGALATAAVVRQHLALGVPGQVEGLLRRGAPDQAALQRRINAQGLPPDWVQALDEAEAAQRAGVRWSGPAWFFPQAGWVQPGALVRSVVKAAGLQFSGQTAVQRLARHGERWQALDAQGHCAGEADAVVVATAGDALRLLEPWGWQAPLRRARGQTSAWTEGPVPLRLPVAGEGYALPLAGGGLLCGATHDAGDDDPEVRASDHQHNFERLQRLTGLLPPADATAWRGRVGWRVQVADRLPIAGALPLPPAAESGARSASTPLRRWPRLPGLYVCTALGGRGLTLAPLLGRALAAGITGAPCPLEQALLDAVDPARWRQRAERGEPAAE